jgi:hypothetical protein
MAMRALLKCLAGAFVSILYAVVRARCAEARPQWTDVSASGLVMGQSLLGGDVAAEGEGG